MEATPANGFAFRKVVTVKVRLEAKTTKATNLPRCAATGSARPNGSVRTRRHEEDRDRQDRRAHRVAALFRPVDIAQIEDERELVEDQRGADAEDDRADVPYDRARAGRHDGSESRGEHEDDSDDLVMQVDTADAAASPTALAGHARISPCTRERDHERQQQQEQRPLPLAEDVVAVAREEAKDIHRLRLQGAGSSR